MACENCSIASRNAMNSMRGIVCTVAASACNRRYGTASHAGIKRDSVRDLVQCRWQRQDVALSLLRHVHHVYVRDTPTREHIKHDTDSPPFTHLCYSAASDRTMSKLTEHLLERFAQRVLDDGARLFERVLGTVVVQLRESLAGARVEEIGSSCRPLAKLEETRSGGCQ
jgi:hypothetical protein